MTFSIRPARMPDDLVAIQETIAAAFGQREEADLVEALHADGSVLVSLVAESAENPCAGHILFSRMWIDPEDRGLPVPAVALAPLAVRPELQHREIGSRLVRAGLAACAELNERIVLVLGHADYYPRFGFDPALAKALVHPFDPGHFMGLELEAGALQGVRGKVRYAAPFGI